MIKEIFEDGKHAGKLLIILFTAISIALIVMNSDDEAGAQNPPQTPNCELYILDPIGGGNNLNSFDEMVVPTGEVALPNSVIQPGWTIYVVLGDQCPNIGMTLYEHPDNSNSPAHPGSIVVAEDFSWELPNGSGGIALTVPEDFNPCGYQLDLYRGGQIDDFSGGARYGPRLISAINWYSEVTCPVQETTTTTGVTSTTVPSTTTPTEQVTTTTEQETTTTSTPDTTSTTVNDTTTSTIQTSSTVGDTTSSTVVSDPQVSLNTTDPEGSNGLTTLPRTGSRDTGNTILLGLSLMAAGFLATLAHRRRLSQ